MATVKKTKKVMKKDSNGGKLGQFTVEVAKTKDTAFKEGMLVGFMLGSVGVFIISLIASGL